MQDRNLRIDTASFGTKDLDRLDLRSSYGDHLNQFTMDLCFGAENEGWECSVSVVWDDAGKIADLQLTIIKNRYYQVFHS